MAVTITAQDRFADDLERMILASRQTQATRVALLTTRDREHALNMLKRAVVRMPLHHFTLAGRRRYNTATCRWVGVGGESSDALSLLRQAQELRGGGVIAIEDCATFLRDDGGDPRLRMTLAEMLSSEKPPEGLVLVFLEPPESARSLPSILADQFVRLDASYPRATELEEIARNEIATYAHRVRLKLSVEQVREEAQSLATGLVGLTRSAARDTLRDALAPDPGDFQAARERLERKKGEALRREMAMNVLDTDSVEEPIGLDYLVEYLEVIRNKVHLHGTGRARGVLLIGPPGTGKTMLARTIGQIVGSQVVEFRISSLMSSLLGETERRFSQAFATLEAMSPNVVFIDEIEKAFGDSSERDGGTMMRCTGALLSWLSDNPYPNYIVATSNSLRRMGEIGQTMTRSERFDACFFVDVPSRESRRRMLARWLEPTIKDAATAAEALAEITEKFSGADLKSLVKHAVMLSEYKGSELTIDLLVAQAERKRNRALRLYDEFAELRRWGAQHCDPAGPGDY